MSKANIRFKTEVMGQPEAVHERLKLWNFPAPESGVVQEEEAKDDLQQLKAELAALQEQMKSFKTQKAKSRFFNFVSDQNPAPQGNHLCSIVSAEEKTEDCEAYLALKLQVLEGKHQGKCCLDRINLFHSSHKERMLARGQMLALCKALNRTQIERIEDLLEIPVWATVDYKATVQRYERETPFPL